MVLYDLSDSRSIHENVGRNGIDLLDRGAVNMLDDCNEEEDKMLNAF